MNSPIMLKPTAVTLAANAVKELDTTMLQNPFRTPMLVDEFRFTVGTTLDARQFIPQVEIKIGREPLTHGYVPVRLLGKFMWGGPAYLTNPSYAYSVWKLDKPLYVPPDQYISIRAASKIYSSSASESVTLSAEIVGRSLSSKDPVPKRIALPWATAWVCPINAGYGAVFENNSAEADVVNPFDVPLNVLRFIGLHSDGSVYASFSGSGRPIRATEYTTVHASDSFGNILIRDPTPFTHLFSTTDRCWTVRARLQPKGFYIFNTTQDYSDLLVSTGPTVVQLGIGLIGYREVPLT